MRSLSLIGAAKFGVFVDLLIGLKTLLRQGILVPIFYGDLVIVFL